MNDSSTVQVLQGLGDLIDNESHMHFLQDLFGNNVVQICLHELEQQIYIPLVLGPQSFKQFDDVWVVELPQNLNFSIGALCVGRVLKSVEYLFECEYFASALVLNFPDVAICSRSYLFEYLEASQDVCLDVGGLVVRGHVFATLCKGKQVIYQAQQQFYLFHRIDIFKVLFIQQSDSPIRVTRGDICQNSHPPLYKSDQTQIRQMTSILHCLIQMQEEKPDSHIKEEEDEEDKQSDHAPDTAPGKRGRTREVNSRQTDEYLRRPTSRINNPNKDLKKAYQKNHLKDSKFNYIRELREIRKKGEDSVSSHGGTDDEDFNINEAVSKKGKKKIAKGSDDSGEDSKKRKKGRKTPQKKVVKKPKEDSATQQEQQESEIDTKKKTTKKPSKQQQKKNQKKGNKANKATKKAQESSSQQESEQNQEQSAKPKKAPPKKVISKPAQTKKKQSKKKQPSEQTSQEESSSVSEKKENKKGQQSINQKPEKQPNKKIIAQQSRKKETQNKQMQEQEEANVNQQQKSHSNSSIQSKEKPIVSTPLNQIKAIDEDNDKASVMEQQNNSSQPEVNQKLQDRIKKILVNEEENQPVKLETFKNTKKSKKKITKLKQKPLKVVEPESEDNSPQDSEQNINLPKTRGASKSEDKKQLETSISKSKDKEVKKDEGKSSRKQTQQEEIEEKLQRRVTRQRSGNKETQLNLRGQVANMKELSKQPKSIAKIEPKNESTELRFEEGQQRIDKFMGKANKNFQLETKQNRKKIPTPKQEEDIEDQQNVNVNLQQPLIQNQQTKLAKQNERKAANNETQGQQSKQQRYKRLTYNSKVIVESIFYYNTKKIEKQRPSSKRRAYVLRSSEDDQSAEYAYERRKRAGKAKRYRKVIIEQTDDYQEPSDDHYSRRVIKRTRKDTNQPQSRKSSQELDSQNQNKLITGKQETAVEQKQM